MKKSKRCENCGGMEIEGVFCDQCGKEIFLAEISMIMSFTENHFCNLNCAKDFIINEVSKGKDTRFDYGV